MTEFSGEVKSVIYENAQNMYKILLVAVSQPLAGYDDDEIKVTGTFGDLELGQEYNFTGDLVTHPKYGLQFQATGCQPALPKETGGVVKYLSSDKFPGIGPKTAEKIVDQLGSGGLKSLQADPALIAKLDLSQKQKDSLLSGLAQMDSFDDLAMTLASYGIPRKVAGRLYQKYHDQTLKKLQADPYLPLGEVTGYSFKQADHLGIGFGIALDSLERANGGILAVLLQALTMEGETYLELDQLLPAAKELTNINFDRLAEAVNDLQDKKKVVVEEGRASLLAPFQVESEIVTDLEDLLAKGKETDYREKDLDQAIKRAEKKLGISYDPEQKQAIKNAVTSPVSILTGGPGSGKTTIIDGILLALKDLADMDEEEAEEAILLAAPTGRAAKRMGEVTGYPAKTIHRLLGLGIDNSEEMELNDLEGEILIVDEMSMVDIYLFEKLLSAISNVHHLVFVGDKDQLPSVGAGKVFADLIEADFIPTCQLKVVHRQKDDSTIIPLAHAVNEGADPAVLLQKTASYSFIPCPPHAVPNAVEQITQAALKSGFAADDIQILGAMYRGDGGINSLNDTLQRVINPEKGNDKAVEAHGENFRLHDRVLQLQNDPERGIYNGEIGKVVAVDPEMLEDEDDEVKLLINFDGKEVAYTQADLNNLTRAYAITIHKSQGSEFPLVILCLTMQNYIMLKRNLLYTAITRASQKLVMVGQEQAFAQAMRVKGNERRTNLVWLLKERFKPDEAKEQAKQDDSASTEDSFDKEEKADDYILTGARISRAEISPMVGMEDLVQGCKNLSEIVRTKGPGA